MIVGLFDHRDEKKRPRTAGRFRSDSYGVSDPIPQNIATLRSICVNQQQPFYQAIEEDEKVRHAGYRPLSAKMRLQIVPSQV